VGFLLQENQTQQKGQSPDFVKLSVVVQLAIASTTNAADIGTNIPFRIVLKIA